MEKYQIRCVVYGGITGHRVGELKDAQGNVRVFNSEEDAQKSLPVSRTTERGVTFDYSVIKC